MRRTSPKADERQRSTANQRSRQQTAAERTHRGHPVETLHRQAGNQAVQALFEQGSLQAKLEVSSPNDPAEREAERVADEVMRTEPPERSSRDRRSVRNRESGASPVVDESSSDSDEGPLQRLCSDCADRLDAGKPLNCPECEAALDDEAEVRRDVSSADADSGRVDGATAQTIQAARSGGRPLPESTRSFFEPRFGQDFSGVRVHTGPGADRAARSVNAKAFTLGSDVVFRSGAYRPESRSGRHLLAHELTHVVQQEGGASQIQRTLDDSYRNHVHLPRQIACLIDKHEGPFDWLGNNAPLIGSDYDDRQEQCRGISGYTGPDVPAEYLFEEWSDPWWAVAVNLEVGDPGWTERLPPCPCTEDAAERSHLFEDKTGFWTSMHHPGAESDYRTPNTDPHSQQCCYDADGDLIPEGEGAGTPDYYNPSQHFMSHQRVDVAPHGDHLDWRTYNQFWEPDDGGGCSERQSDSGDEHSNPLREDPTRPQKPGAGSSGHVP